MLDHNTFGTAGLKQLATGLAINPMLTHLSLTYCNLDAESAKPLQQILAFVETKIEYLNLQGNYLGNDGAVSLMKAVHINNVLLELGLADNQFGEKQEVMDNLVLVIKENPVIFQIDIKHNGIYKDGARKILEACKEKKTTKVEMSLETPAELANEINTFMAKIKPKKRARGKGLMKKKG